MILAAVSAVGTPSPCTLTGSIAAVAVAGTATSVAATINKPAANSGRVYLTWVDVGTITATTISQNGGAFNSYSSGGILTFADGDTISIKTTGDGVGESRAYTLFDADSGAIVATGTHTGA